MFFLALPTALAFENTGPLLNARGGHTATLLMNGTVLVAGGHGGPNAILDTAELYDPESGTWSLTSGKLVAARTGHTATLLPDGQVLVAGGGSSGALVSAELYDPVSRTWRATGSLIAKRWLHTATLLKSGKVLVVGGSSLGAGHVTSAELYDPSTGQWSLTGAPANSRLIHTATLLQNGKVLVTGGTGATNGPEITSTSELYDPDSGTWSATGSLADARYAHRATLLWNGQVLVTGGFNHQKGHLTTTEVYDPATGAWSMRGPLTRARYYHTATLLANGKVIVAGGITGHPWPDAELYEPTAGTWSDVMDLAEARWEHTATLLRSGAVLVAGGRGSSPQGAPLASAELFIPLPGDTGNAANISTRGLVRDSSSEMIAGFIIQGGGQKKVIVRGLGPSLSKSGVATPVQDPTLELRDSNGAMLRSNDNWQSSQSVEIIATGIAPEDPRESALISTLDPGAYTAQLRGKSGPNGSGFGIGLIEVYDLDSQPSSTRLANLSTRGEVALGDNALIGGFILINKATSIVVRAIGPSLAQHGVAGVLADPALELRDSQGSLLAANDDWRSSQQEAITATGLAPTNDAESAVAANLVPGSYTAVVRGVNNKTGIALVEVYSLSH